MEEQFVEAVNRLISELQKGWDSVKTDSAWIGEDEAYRLLGIRKPSVPDNQSE